MQDAKSFPSYKIAAREAESAKYWIIIYFAAEQPPRGALFIAGGLLI